VLVRLSSRFLGRGLTRLALPLAAIPFWVLFNVQKANAVMAECTALTIGPALAVDAADGLLPSEPRLLSLSHRAAVVRAVAASIFHNVQRVQLPLPGFGFSAAAGSVHPNAAALLEHLEWRCGLVPVAGRVGGWPLPDAPLDDTAAFQKRVLPALDVRGRVLTLRMLALALCLDGHVNLPDRWYFVRCARAAGMPVTAETMREFRSLEILFGVGALNASALNELFDEYLRPRPARERTGRRRAVQKPRQTGDSGGWVADVCLTLFAR